MQPSDSPDAPPAPPAPVAAAAPESAAEAVNHRDAGEPAAHEATRPDLIGRMITLSGLLAGFSFTALIQLIILNDMRDVVALTIVFSLLSSVTYILALFSFVASTSIPLHTPHGRSTAASVELFAYYIFWMATVALLITIALAGWIHSTLVGAVGAVITLFALAGLAALLFIRGRVL